MAGILVALVVTLVSACALNVGYLIEHSVASKLPPLSLRRPIASVRLLLRPRWLMGFGIEVGGWLLYVLALALAPLSLVQATAAGGIGILAVMVSRYTGVPLTPLEQVGSVLSVAGLAVLGISLAGNSDKGTSGSALAVGLWLVASGVATVLALRVGPRLIGGGPAYGVGAGILFAAGDVSTKTTVAGGEHAAFVPALIVSYALGTMVLQAAFQRANALVAAGLATLLTQCSPDRGRDDDLRGTAAVRHARRAADPRVHARDRRGGLSGPAPTRRRNSRRAARGARAVRRRRLSVLVPFFLPRGTIPERTLLVRTVS